MGLFTYLLTFLQSSTWFLLRSRVTFLLTILGKPKAGDMLWNPVSIPWSHMRAMPVAFVHTIMKSYLYTRGHEPSHTHANTLMVQEAAHIFIFSVIPLHVAVCQG